MENITITYKLLKTGGNGYKDVQFFADDEETYGSGYKTDDGTICMTRCPSCHAENYAMVVATGKCAWCSFDPNEDAEEEK